MEPVVSGVGREGPAYHLELLRADTDLSRSQCYWERGLDMKVYGRISGASNARFSGPVRSQRRSRQL